MARKRMLDPNMWQSEDISRLSVFARYLFIGMISNADDEGRGRANPNYLKSTIFPYDNMRTADINKALSEISRYTSVVLYERAHSMYYAFLNWNKWQKVDRPTKSILPPPPSSAELENPLVEATDSPENGEFEGILCDSSNARRGLDERSLLIEEKRKEEKDIYRETGSLSRIDYQKIVDLFHSLCPSLPRVRTVSEKRKKAIRARFNAGETMESFAEVFKMAEASDFLTGRNGAWVGCGFDWLLKEANWIKTLEGTYENKAKSKAGYEDDRYEGVVL